MNVVETHEAAHAVAARALGVQVIHATAESDNPHVRTKYKLGRTVQEAIRTIERLAIVDLAGVERSDCSTIDSVTLLCHDTRHGTTAGPKEGSVHCCRTSSSAAQTIASRKESSGTASEEGRE